MTRKLIAMRWSRWVATRPPPSARAALDEEVVALDLVRDARRRRGPRATAASRSLSLTRSSCRPRMRVVPAAKAAATARIGYSSIIEGARAAGTSTPPSSLARTRRSATSSPPSTRRSRISMSRAHLEQRRQQPGAQRVHHHALDDDVGARNDQRRDDRERGRGRDRPARRPARAAVPGGPASVMRRPSPSIVDAHVGAEMGEHLLGVVARGLAPRSRSSSPRALRPASSTADLICAEATGVR